MKADTETRIAPLRGAGSAFERPVADRRRRELLFASAEVVGQLVCGIGVRRTVSFWSDNLYRIYGYEPGRVMPSHDVVYAILHSDARAGGVEIAGSRPPLEPSGAHLASAEQMVGIA